MATVNLAIGSNGTDLAVGEFNKVGIHRVHVDLTKHNLTSANLLKLLNIPKGAYIKSVVADVTTADSVAAATADIGLYKQVDDTAIDADGILNELALGSVNRTAPAACAASTGASSAYDAFVGVVQGAAGGGATNDNAIFDLILEIADLSNPTVTTYT